MNKTREEIITQFHQAFGQEINVEPTIKLLKFRRTLIEEETKELFADIDTAIAHLEKRKEVPKELYINMLKELSDVQVVISGTSVALKPLRKLDEAFKRVFESNMSKLGADGKPIYREDGKVLKGPNYVEPDLSELID